MILGVTLIAIYPAVGNSQSLEIRSGDPVPRDVRDLYDRGLQYLVANQDEGGCWPSGHRGAGVAGMGLMCFLASGEDPNFGLYSANVRRALRFILRQQDPETGYFGQSMYHHGFAMLALAEAYGAVDDRTLWSETGVDSELRIGQSLELAVRAAITSQKNNPLGAWRYSPAGMEADTSVTGGVLMGLLAARNAGIEVPDDAIDRSIGYFTQMTAESGQVAYSNGAGGFNESMARISIGTLVFAISRRKDLPQFAQTLGYLRDQLQGGTSGHGGVEYQSYYQAQALFQGDLELWKKWNGNLIDRLKASQKASGGFDGTQGPYVATTLSLLAVAVNYRFLPIYER
ncbi:squalene--hopene cyclase [Rhodopirellula sp.]|nr:squalene--hopene cyclase [Rhodopirellula sp.]MDB4678986.1 squalene--hopene cyclase [Rhodopirellula sp.]